MSDGYSWCQQRPSPRHRTVHESTQEKTPNPHMQSPSQYCVATCYSDIQQHTFTQKAAITQAVKLSFSSRTISIGQQQPQAELGVYTSPKFHIARTYEIIHYLSSCLYSERQECSLLCTMETYRTHKSFHTPTN